MQRAVFQLLIHRIPLDEAYTSVLPNKLLEKVYACGLHYYQRVYLEFPQIFKDNFSNPDLIGHFRSVSHRGQFEKRGVDAAFWPEHFFYDELHDTYTCPEGKTLPHQRARQPVGKTNHIYQARREDCASCPHKQKCCPGDHVKRRWIVRSVYDPAVVSFIEKMKTEEAKAIYKQRGAIAEFPNAWIKEKIGLRQFHLRGLVKVGVEALWACLTYNIQQWIRLCWRPRLAKAEM